MHVCYSSTIPPPSIRHYHISAENKRIPPSKALRMAGGVRTCAFHRWGRVRYVYASTYYYNNNNNAIVTLTLPAAHTTRDVRNCSILISHSSASVGRTVFIFYLCLQSGKRLLFSKIFISFGRRSINADQLRHFIPWS